MHLFTMQSQCVLNRSSNQDAHYSFQSRRFLEIEHKISPLQLVNLHRNRRYFVVKLHTWFCLSYFLKTNITFYCIYQYFMSITSFFQHRICFSIQLQLQLVNLHRNRRYFVIKLHTWFCLSYFLKTNITFIAFINIL